MSALPEFVGFPKIARISREIVVTEKIDGTNACVYIPEVEGEFACGNCARHPEDRDFCECAKFQSPTEIFAASRNRCGEYPGGDHGSPNSLRPDRGRVEGDGHARIGFDLPKLGRLVLHVRRALHEEVHAQPRPPVPFRQGPQAVHVQ